MRFEDLPTPYQGFVSDLLSRAGFDAATFHLAIPAGDEMFFKGVLPGYPKRPGAAFFRYVESALRTYDVYRQLAEHLGGFERLGPVLDFGSGWGRLTRALIHRLPARDIWVSDLYAEAIGWQAETFGVNGLVSVTRPDRFALTQTHGVVFAASVFSHLPDRLFRGWLGRLHALVAPRGLLAFSVHDASYAPPEQAVDGRGFGYAQTSESATHDTAIYGMSYVTEGYVAGVIADVLGPQAAYRRFPRALFESQDLYVIGGAETDLAGLALAASPLLGVGPVGPGEPLTGWAIEPSPGEAVVRLRLYAGDALLAEAAPEGERVDMQAYFPGSPNPPVGWRFPPQTSGADLRVEAESSRGRTANAYVRLEPGADGAFPRI